MNDDLKIKFSADVGALNDGFEAMKRTLEGAQKKTFETINAIRAYGQSVEYATAQGMASIPTFVEFRKQFELLQKESEKAAKAVTDTADAFKLAGPGIGFYARELHAVLDELAAGRTKQLEGTVMNIASTFTVANPAIGSVAVAVAGFAAAIGYAVQQVTSFNAVMRDLKIENAARNFEAVTADTARMVAELRNMRTEFSTIFNGLSFKESGQIVSQFQSVTNGYANAVDTMVLITRGWQRANQAGAEETNEFAKSIADLVKAAQTPQETMKALGEINRKMTADEQAAALAMAESGTIYTRQAQILDALAQSVIRQVTVYRDLKLEANETNGKIAGGNRGIEEAKAKNAALTAEIDRLVSSLRKKTEAAQTDLKTADDLAAAAKRESQAFATQYEKLLELENAERSQIGSIEALRVAIEKDPQNSGLINALEMLIQRLSLLKVQIKEVKSEIAGTSEFVEATNRINLMIASGKSGQREILQAQIDAQKALLNTIDPSVQATKFNQVAQEIRLKQQQLTALDTTEYLRQQDIKLVKARENASQIVQIRQETLNKLKSEGYSNDSASVLAAEKSLEEAKINLKRMGAKESERISGEETKAAIANVDAQMEAVKDAGNLKDISRREELQKLVALENEKLRITIEGINNQTKSEREKNALIEKAEAESARNRAKIKQQLDRQMMAEERAMASEISNSFVSSAASILKGQMTLKQGLLQIGEQIVTAQIKQYATSFLQKTLFSMREKAVDVGLKQTDLATTIATEEGKTVAVVSGEEIRAAAAQSGAATGFAAKIASVVKSIMASASEAFAGVFGFLAPEMGPAAAGPAVAAEATVAAAASSLPSFAVGAWELPTDMVAQVHKG